MKVWLTHSQNKSISLYYNELWIELWEPLPINVTSWKCLSCLQWLPLHCYVCGFIVCCLSNGATELLVTHQCTTYTYSWSVSMKFSCSIMFISVMKGGSSSSGLKMLLSWLCNKTELVSSSSLHTQECFHLFKAQSKHRNWHNSEK